MKIQKQLPFNPIRVNPLFVFMIITIIMVHLSGCETNETMETEKEKMDGEPEITLRVNKFTISQDTEINHFVGPVDDSLFIGIADSEKHSNEGQPRTVAIYLCNSREISQWIFKEITGQDATLSTEDINVEISITNDSVTGVLDLDNEASKPFTAVLTTGKAGLYRATYFQGGIDFNIDWIVLPDGRQRGPLDGKGNDIPPPPPMFLRWR